MHQHNQLELFCGPHPTKELANLQDFCIFGEFPFKVKEDNTNGMSILKDLHLFCACRIRLSPTRPCRFARLRTSRRKK